MNSTATLEKLDRYIRARYPIVAICSFEESRVLDAIDTIATKRGRIISTWTITTGLQNLSGTEPDNTRDPVAALDVISDYAPDADPVLFVLKDLHNLTNDPVIVRYLRDIAAKFETSRHTLILLSPVFQVPADLEKTIAILDWPLPDVDELAAILKKCEQELPERIHVTLNGNREKVIQAMRGLTAFESSSVLLAAIAATGEMGESVIPHIIGEKRQIIRKSGVLEFYDADVNFNQVGGLENLKHYAEVKRHAFSKEAAAFGVDAPKGVLLVGIPGTGKSLSAKAIAGGQMPLLRMDIGALMGSLVGQSEANMRSALKVAEAIAPCVLWVDEIEKALGGIGGSESDGGTSMRVFGTLLTWMQETTAPVYVVATANDVRSLKPELLRRFDDIFWVDLPGLKDREEILSVHLTRRNQVTAGFDLEAISKATWGMTGAEIEKVVKTALEAAFFEGKSLTNTHLLRASSQIVPIMQTMGEKINELRSWSNGRAHEAGAPLDPKPEYAAKVDRTKDL
ncbi:MAG: AAA family ATPase [Anaerolineaceae bacterium]|nr:AAA family ATPase [Anaerolineaceae bacterium]